ncbi:hypothetical protein [Streptomyces atratus]|uniref:hypothetical protein n=1 Tax=Streptomyces atratus TaxID=1893 RepID=UPI0015A572A2
MDIELLRELRRLGPVTRDDGGDAVGVDAPVAEVRRVVGGRALVLTGDDRRRADPVTERDAEALLTANVLLGTAGELTVFVSVLVVAVRRRSPAVGRSRGHGPRAWPDNAFSPSSGTR